MSRLARHATLMLVVSSIGLAACGGGKSSNGTGGTGGGQGGSGGSTTTGGTGGIVSDGGAGTDGSTPDAGPTPPSCAAPGVGLDRCGADHDSCCKSLLIAAGSFERTYGANVDGGADPASVSAFRLDKYDVTVGRFRKFVAAARAGGSDGGVGTFPAAGAGKHTHLSSGAGLADVSPDAGAPHETGWLAADDANVTLTDANLTACGPTSAWTPAAGDHEDAPMNCVNWWEAYAFCIWDGGFLPSEAEWEYAAAAGDMQRPFPWGTTAPGTANQYAIYDCNYPDSTQTCDVSGNIAPVGTASKGGGLWGQLDLAGNQAQWVLDWYADAYVSPCADGARLSNGSSRIIRGGSFVDNIKALAPAHRDANNPSLRNDFISFRCARMP
ncbi:MAG TPA: SUMF1/EgtB/PvdO family nonheme iron enzyme [Polyangia bacterium]|nr:SUMF1/EgtB/PvdO family nonheme iron enzyme [Polyangia bacterium]